MRPPSSPAPGVLIGLSAVVMALHEGNLAVLTTRDEVGVDALPFGPFDPEKDRTFELAIRDFVTVQTGFRPRFVEQLYTFGDIGRDAPRAAEDPGRRRVVSVGYIALSTKATRPAEAARWLPVEDMFPWENWRNGSPPIIADRIADPLFKWAGSDDARRSRVQSLFALGETARWNEERVLERYELLYEAGIVQEASRDCGDVMDDDSGLGRAMASDHRRILATALGRLRAKLKYRPVLFDLAASPFTLSALQSAAEAICGLSLHKQNFRRGVERAGLVEPTGEISSTTGGRPAELYRFAEADASSGRAPGVALPAIR